ncbi:hypothetical protein ACA910_001006 [Epithemia clementina (nom. ined.)]
MLTTPSRTGMNSTQPKRRLASVTVNIPSSPDGHLITQSLPMTKEGEELTIKHWAGHLPANGDNHKYFFYWLFEPETIDDNTPILIWLNGGPGCSSMDGLFLENGPFQWIVVDGKYMLQKNPFSWHNAPAYTLYIDQPVGTGLSFTTSKDYPTNDAEINIDFYYFLTSFFDLHADKFVENGSVKRKLFFSGESHAGHYIPSMMNFILKQNEDHKKVNIPLAGAAIGNGWMDPVYQYAAAEAAYGHGLLDLAQVNAFDKDEKTCQELLRNGNYRSGVCFSLLDNVVAQSFGGSSHYKVSQYDVRLSEQRGSDRQFPKGHRVTECYLGGRKLPSWESGNMDCAIKDSVLDMIHAQAASQAGQKFLECTDPPYNALAHQDGKGVVDDIVEVLQHPSKPRLLIFNGVEDLICNHVGNEKVLENLPWKGRDQWKTAKRYAWFAGRQLEQPAGFMKEFENLLFLKLLNAGHMVPVDIPDLSLVMMKLFLAGDSFTDSLQDIDALAEAPPASCPICVTCPAPEACPQCPNENTPAPAGQTVNCTAEVAQAKQEVMSTFEGTSGISRSIAWAIPMIALVLVLVGIILYRQKREERELVSTVVSRAELDEPQYHDEPENGEKSNGSII